MPFDKSQPYSLYADNVGDIFYAQGGLYYTSGPPNSLVPALPTTLPSNMAVTTPVNCKDFGATPSNTASGNATAINAALSRSGIVQITVPGTYLVNATLLIPSNTDFVVGKGVTLKLADHINLTLLANASAFNGPTFSSLPVIGWTTAGPDGTSIPAFRATIPLSGTVAGIDTTHPVGSWIAVLPAVTVPNPTTAFTAGFAGIFEVKTAAAGVITYDMMAQPPSGGNSASGGTLFAVDVNIRVYGGGTLDGNGANQDATYGASHPYTNLTWFHNCRGVWIDGLVIKRAKSWGIASNSVADYRVTNIDADDWAVLVGAGDAVHMTGGHQRCIVEKIFGSCDDNIVGLTADDTALFPFWQPGDSDAIVIRDIFSNDGTTAGIVGVWGSSKYNHRSVLIDGVHGKGGSGVVMNVYAPTAMNACTGGSLTIRRIHAQCSSASVALQGGGTWGTIDISDVRNESVNGAATTNIKLSTVQTISSLKVDGVVSGLTSKGSPLVQITDATISAVTFNGLLAIPMSTAVPVIQIDGAAAIAKMLITNCSTTAAASGAGALASIIATASVTELHLSDCTYTGVSSTGSLVNVGASAVLSNLGFLNSRAVLASGFLATAATPPATTGAPAVVQTINNNAGNITVTATPVPASLVSCTGTQALSVLFTLPPVAQVASGFFLSIYTAAAVSVASTWASTGGTFVGAPATLVAGSTTRFVLNGTVWQLT